MHALQCITSVESCRSVQIGAELLLLNVFCVAERNSLCDTCHFQHICGKKQLTLEQTQTAYKTVKHVN